MDKILAHVNLFAALLFAFTVPGTVFAGEQEAIRLCENKIRNEYGVSDFRHVYADQQGYDKWKVHGKVKYRDSKNPFNCKVKNGYVKSYYYDGPHARPEGPNNEAAVAIGAGLAVLGAALAGAAIGDDGGRSQSPRGVSKNRFEDECHDVLSYRMRDEHHLSADVRIQDSQIHGNSLQGKGKVRWANNRVDHFTYVCYFNKHGLVSDSKYYLF